MHVDEAAFHGTLLRVGTYFIASCLKVHVYSYPLVNSSSAAERAFSILESEKYILVQSTPLIDYGLH